MIRVPGKKTGVAAAAVLLAGGAAVAALGGDEPASVRNAAFVDSQATNQLMHDVTAATERIFTIRPDAVGMTRKRAEALLVGDAVDQYDELYGPYLARARAQGLTLVTRVRAVGVVAQQTDQAELLVFADQAGTTSAGQSGVGAAQLVLTASRTGDEWKIAGIELL